MHYKNFDGGSDHCGRGDGAAKDRSHSFVDMANPGDVRTTFTDSENHSRRHCAHQEQLVFDDPYSAHKPDGKPSTHQPTDTTPPPAPPVMPPEVPTAPVPPVNTPEGPVSANSLDIGSIRGVNLSGAEWSKSRPNDNQFWPTAQELDYYKSKGMNTVRLPIAWEQFQPALNGPLDQNEMAQLDKFLAAADQRGMKVLIDLHNYDRYTPSHGAGGTGVGQEENGLVVGQAGLPVSALSDFWQKMANHVNANKTDSSAVSGFDLMNEPHDVGGTWANTATQVVQAIRATGDNHTLVVEGDGWARNFNGLESLAHSDKNIAFEAHSYWDSNGSGGYAADGPGDPNRGVNEIKPFVSWLKQNNASGFVGEWGVPSNDSGWEPTIKNFIQYLNENNVGNTVWAGGPGWGGYKLSVEPEGGQDKAIMSAIVEANQGQYF